MSRADLILFCLFSQIFLVTANACPYTAPFRAGSTKRVIQGFHGSYSHLPPLEYGVDFALDVGTGIIASRGGTVVQSIFHHGPGKPDPSYLAKSNYLIIDHGDQSYTLYAHLLKDKTYVKIGQKVQRGELLALSGCSGFCEEPHLHFEVFQKDKNARKSIPFKFVTAKGIVDGPKRGDRIKAVATPRHFKCRTEP